MSKGSENIQSKDDRLKELERRLKSLGVTEKIFKKGGTFDDVEYLPTGQIEIDSILSNGQGIPRGTLVEFCGESQSGKSYLAYKLMAEANKRGGWVCYANVENSFYPPRAKDLGVLVDDPNAFRLLENIETAEEYGEIIYALVDSCLYDVIVVDSISAMIPSVEVEKGLQDVSKIGSHAVFIKRFTKKLMNKCAKTGTIVVLINQLYYGQGKIPGGQMVLQATGGQAMTFFPHMRIWINKIGGAKGKVIDSDNQIVGGKSKAILMKTRYSTPLLETEFPIMFGESESDPVSEFLFRAKARGAEYISVYRKMYRYIDASSGITVSDKNGGAFIKLLLGVPAPESKTRNDKSQNAFEFICGRLKITDDQAAKLLEFCEGYQSLEETESNNDDD